MYNYNNVTTEQNINVHGNTFVSVNNMVHMFLK
jgi:hypothetical protein